MRLAKSRSRGPGGGVDVGAHGIQQVEEMSVARAAASAPLIRPGSGKRRPNPHLSPAPLPLPKAEVPSRQIEASARQEKPRARSARPSASSGANGATPREVRERDRDRPPSVSREHRRSGEESFDELVLKCARQAKELKDLRRRCKELDSSASQCVEQFAQTEPFSAAAPPERRRSKEKALDGFILEDFEEQRAQLDTMHVEAAAKSRDLGHAKETVVHLQQQLQQERLMSEQYRSQVELLEVQLQQALQRRPGAEGGDSTEAALAAHALASSRPLSAKSVKTPMSSRPPSACSGTGGGSRPPSRPQSASRPQMNAWSEGVGSLPSSLPGSRAASGPPSPAAAAIPKGLELPATSNPGRIRRRTVPDPDPVASPPCGPTPAPVADPEGVFEDEELSASSSDDEDAHFRQAWVAARAMR